jgi:hypothetical protein
MTRPTPRRLWKYLCGPLRLTTYFRGPGDGRGRPQIPAAVLVWALVVGQVLRECSFHGVEALVRSPARRALRVARGFGDDALAYFTERLDPGPTRRALAATVRRAKRNKAFRPSRWIGVAVDGTGAGHGQVEGCPLCHPVRDGQGQVLGYLHHFVMISVVGTAGAARRCRAVWRATRVDVAASGSCRGRSGRWADALPITSWPTASLRRRRFCTSRATWGCASWPG